MAEARDSGSLLQVVSEPSDWSIILTSHWLVTEQPLRFSEPVPVAREQQPLRFSEPVPVAREQPSRFIEAQEPVRLSEPEPSQPAILPARLTPIR